MGQIIVERFSELSATASEDFSSCFVFIFQNLGHRLPFEMGSV